MYVAHVLHQPAVYQVCLLASFEIARVFWLSLAVSGAMQSLVKAFNCAFPCLG